MITGICPFCHEPATARNGCVVCLRKRNFQREVGKVNLFLACAWLFWGILSVLGAWGFWYAVCWIWERTAH